MGAQAHSRGRALAFCIMRSCGSTLTASMYTHSAHSTCTRRLTAHMPHTHGRCSVGHTDARQLSWPTGAGAKSLAIGVAEGVHGLLRTLAPKAASPATKKPPAPGRTRNAKAWRVLGCAMNATARHGRACNSRGQIRQINMLPLLLMPVHRKSPSATQRRTGGRAP